MTENDINHTWDIVKNIREKFLLEHPKYECQLADTLIADQYITENIDIIERELQVQQNDTIFDNITKEALEIGAEIYTYLNYCPPRIIQFYKELLLKGSEKEIILVLTNIMKTRRNAEMETAESIWKKIDLEFNFLYQNIEKITRKQWSKDHIFDFRNESLKGLIKELGVSFLFFYIK